MPIPMQRSASLASPEEPSNGSTSPGIPLRTCSLSAWRWTPAGQLLYEIENRTQSWLDLNVGGRTLFRETSRFWINSEDQTTPTWLRDGSFVWLSAQSGFAHAYHYRADGSLIRPLTSGRWEVRDVHGVDERNGWLYFSGTERSLDWRGHLSRKTRRRRTAASVTDVRHSRRTVQPGFQLLLRSLERRHDADAGVAAQGERPTTCVSFTRMWSARLRSTSLSIPEFMQVKTRDGFTMEAMMIKPPDFDPRRKYPVYQFTYAGPHSQSVKNAWTLQTMYHQLLAQKGIVVWICDNRSASGKGLEATSAVYRRFGQSELSDIEDGVSWLKRQPFIDAARIGIHGWSFGGFMTAYALTHSTSFAMGIAGGTVSDWRDYDTVYTERFLGRPQDNPDGYRNSSPRFSAANLHGELLLIHGAIDDNVHVQNTMQLAYELQRANKPFRLMLYPKSRHGVTDPWLVHHLRELMLAYTLEHLKP